MKTIKGVFSFVLILTAFLAGSLSFCRAQILIGGVSNSSESLVQLSSAPVSGTFWSAQLNLPPWPFDPLPQLPVYAYGPASNDVFVIDDRAWDYGASWSQLNANAAFAGGGGMFAMDDDSGPPSLGGDPIFSTGGGPIFTTQVFTTNDLWLEIITMTNETAALVIHPPWNVTNGVYDLQYTTNLVPPVSWQWVLRTAPGQTNLLVTNATDPQGFYRISLINPSSGTDQWIAFPFSVGSAYGNLHLWLYISSQVTNSGTVSIPGLGFSTNFSLSAGTVTSMTISGDSIINSYDAVTTNGIHITAMQPVSVYGLNYFPFVSLALTAYPTAMLGTNYFVIAHPSDPYGYGSGNSQFAVLGTASNTTVTVTPSVNAYLSGHSGTNSYTETLQPGETYAVRSSSPTNDVTGTLITSDKPVGVIAGVSVGYVPNSGNGGFGQLEQEQLPVASWGNQTLALSFGRTNGDIYRVLTASSNTVVTTNGVTAVTLQPGQIYDTLLDGAVEFQGSNPIQVAQFALGGNNDHNLGNPCEILLPPLGHYLNSYTVTVPAYSPGSTGDFFTNYLNLIVPQSAISTTLLDGSTVAATNFVTITNSGYSAARVPVVAGTHKVASSQPIEVEVYGFGDSDAYGYLGGVTTFP